MMPMKSFRLEIVADASDPVVAFDGRQSAIAAELQRGV